MIKWINKSREVNTDTGKHCNTIRAIKMLKVSHRGYMLRSVKLTPLKDVLSRDILLSLLA